MCILTATREKVHRQVNMLKRVKANYIKTGKIAVGSALSIMIADILGLSFGTAAGIITLLSVQNTKKETLQVAGRRILAFIIAIILSWVVFNMLGYTAITFGVFLFIFVIICELGSLSEGISICAVLVTHFLTLQRMNMQDVWNEFLLLVVGIGVGAVTNLYIPRNVREIKESQIYIEGKMREILVRLAGQLKQPDNQRVLIAIQELHLYIQHAVKLAYENQNNTFLSDTQYFISYMELRLTQLTVIERICSLVEKVDASLPQAVELAEFFEHVADSFRETNDGVRLLEEYEKLKLYFEQDKLPVERREFENRAVLYLILGEMQWFLQLKNDFAANLTEKQLSLYWDDEE